jgi:hypothetical protein
MQDDEFCTRFGQLTNLGSQMELVGFHILHVVLLYDSYLHGLGFLKNAAKLQNKMKSEK